VYCAQRFEVELLTLDHVQPRARGGDRSAGNIVTACIPCNVRKGHTPLARFLRADALARKNFFERAKWVWKRHLRSVEEELRKLGSGG
jgi:5-methylcytosine-specific restriction endonuclease McrA